MARSLSLPNLASLPDTVARPRYARGDLRAGILHIGLGNFHRAHQAVYLDDLFNDGRDHDWAIVGAGVRQGDAAMRQALAPQDWLTTVVELEPGANRARVTGPMIGFVPVNEDGIAVVDAASIRQQELSTPIIPKSATMPPIWMRLEACSAHCSRP